jgi:FMN-dependent NADH-azoreductase
MDQFLASDVIVIGAPMYNFSIPSQLKAWIDRIAVAGKTFRYGPNGPEGLAKGKKVVIASARGGAYGDESPADFQEPYLRHVFGFLGISDIEFVRAEGVAHGPEAEGGRAGRRRTRGSRRRCRSQRELRAPRACGGRLPARPGSPDRGSPSP